jgi:DNA-binding NarL/FixJ family response regulator
MRVLIVDDHPIVRGVICRLLRCERNVEIAGQVGSAREAIEQTKQLRPDVVLLDLSLPDIGGLDAIPEIKNACPATQIVLLSGHAASHIVEEGLRAGASGYILKSDASNELGAALLALSRGEVYVCNRLSNKALETRNLPAV